MKINEVNSTTATVSEIRIPGFGPKPTPKPAPKPTPNTSWRGKGDYAGISYDSKSRTVTLPDGNKVPVAGPDEAKKVADDWVKKNIATKSKQQPKAPKGSKPLASPAVRASVAFVDAANLAIMGYVTGITFKDFYLEYASNGFDMEKVLRDSNNNFWGDLVAAIITKNLVVYFTASVIKRGLLRNKTLLVKTAQTNVWKSFLKWAGAAGLVIGPGVTGFASMPPEVWKAVELQVFGPEK